ncbi:MAG TPA: alternative ribosome rescue aminoacyl-tRNA hydrolase ArfB [Rhizomicrobium sp.]|jgi:ribosome-associated protein|nr:alternative ribosome rescue aminoacyl-tRNA hydrolase ArfB [Rhizomicrobium sp.]
MSLPTSLYVNHRITIADSELEESFIRSSGPGGQNVNKVSSAVQLRFDVRASPSLTEPARQALLGGGRLTRDGVLVITAQRFREQERNRADARARLVEILRRAATPKPVRRATKIPKASKRKRLDGKKHRAEIKRGRAKPD